MLSARCLILFPILATMTGCASLNVRLDRYSGESKERPTLYTATRADAGGAWYLLSRPFKNLVGKSYATDAQDGLMFLFLPIAIADLPVAASLDTVMLPYDIYKRETYVPERPIDPDQYLRDTEPL